MIIAKLAPADGQSATAARASAYLIAKQLRPTTASRRAKSPGKSLWPRTIARIVLTLSGLLRLTNVAYNRTARAFPETGGRISS
ncbi:MAG: hypothetical protein ACXW3C_19005 [Pyrinomonadaceae bacterium]